MHSAWLRVVAGGSVLAGWKQAPTTSPPDLHGHTETHQQSYADLPVACQKSIKCAWFWITISTQTWDLHVVMMWGWFIIQNWTCNPKSRTYTSRWCHNGSWFGIEEKEQNLEPTLCAAVALLVDLRSKIKSKPITLHTVLVWSWVSKRSWIFNQKPGTYTLCWCRIGGWHRISICYLKFLQHLGPTLCVGVALELELILTFQPTPGRHTLPWQGIAFWRWWFS